MLKPAQYVEKNAVHLRGVLHFFYICG